MIPLRLAQRVVHVFGVSNTDVDSLDASLLTGGAAPGAPYLPEVTHITTGRIRQHFPDERRTGSRRRTSNVGCTDSNALPSEGRGFDPHRAHTVVRSKVPTDQIAALIRANAGTWLAILAEYYDRWPAGYTTIAGRPRILMPCARRVPRDRARLNLMIRLDDPTYRTETRTARPSRTTRPSIGEGLARFGSSQQHSRTPLTANKATPHRDTLV